VSNRRLEIKEGRAQLYCLKLTVNAKGRYTWVVVVPSSNAGSDEQVVEVVPFATLVRPKTRKVVMTG